MRKEFFWHLDNNDNCSDDGDDDDDDDDDELNKEQSHLLREETQTGLVCLHDHIKNKNKNKTEKWLNITEN